MNKDVQRLREPGAWVLLGSVALQILAGLIGLLFGRGRLPFTIQAFQFVTADQFFTGVAATGVVVLAVLLVTRIGGPPTRGARNIVLGGLVVLGVIALFDVICMLAGLGAGSGDTGVLLDSETTAKLTMFLYGLSKLAVLAVGGYYVLTVFQSFAPAGQYAAPYGGQQGWGQPGAQPYGQPGTQPAYGPPPQAPMYGQAPQQYPPQGYVRAPYGQPGAPGQPGQPVQPGQPAPAAYGPPPQPGARAPQPSGPPPAPPQPPAPQASAPPAAAASEEMEGEWTRAYGTGDVGKPEPSGTPESSSGEGSSGSPERPGDSYRAPE